MLKQNLLRYLFRIIFEKSEIFINNCIGFQADNDLEITWKDNHISRFDLNWLQERSFLTENQNEYLDQNYIKPKLWSNDQFSLKEFQAADVMESDEGIKEFKVPNFN